jgi:CHAD domain-containing protein
MATQEKQPGADAEERETSPVSASTRRAYEAFDARPVRRWLESHAPRAGWTLEPAPRLLIEEDYFDTEDRRFHRAGLSLCLRTAEGSVEAVLRPLSGAGPRAAGVAPERAPAAGRKPEALRSAPGTLGERVRALAGSRALLPSLALRLEVEILTLRPGQGPPGTLHLVETSVPLEQDAPPLRLARVELRSAGEPPAGLTALLGELEAACGLRPASGSNYEAAQRACGERPEEEPGLGPSRVEKGQTVGEAAYAVLRKQLARWLRHEPGTRLGEDIEELHDMRVAVRRTRAALRLYRGHLPVSVLAVEPELRWLGSVLGEVRDLDVQLDQLARWQASLDEADRPALEVLRELLARRHRRARRAMLRSLDTKRYERLVARWSGLLRRAPGLRLPATRPPVLAAAPLLIEQHYRRVSKRGRKITLRSPAGRYHKLRIRCKQLRYALEFHAPLYGEPARRLIRGLVRLQDLLGDHQDADVALGWLREIVERPPRRLPPETYFIVGRLAERYERRAAELRRGFPRAFARLRGRRWRRLSKAMRRAAPSPDPPPTRRDPAESGP